VEQIWPTLGLIWTKIVWHTQHVLKCRQGDLCLDVSRGLGYLLKGGGGRGIFGIYLKNSREQKRLNFQSEKKKRMRMTRKMD